MKPDYIDKEDEKMWDAYLLEKYPIDYEKEYHRLKASLEGWRIWGAISIAFVLGWIANFIINLLE